MPSATKVQIWHWQVWKVSYFPSGLHWFFLFLAFFHYKTVLWYIDQIWLSMKYEGTKNIAQMKCTIFKKWNHRSLKFGLYAVSNVQLLWAICHFVRNGQEWNASICTLKSLNKAGVAKSDMPGLKYKSKCHMRHGWLFLTCPQDEVNSNRKFVIIDDGHSVSSFRWRKLKNVCDTSGLYYFLTQAMCKENK